MQKVFMNLPKPNNRIWRTPLVCLLFTAWAVQAEAQLLAQKTEPAPSVRQDNGRVSLNDALRILTDRYKVQFGYHSTLTDGQYTWSADWLSEKSLEKSLKNLLTPLGLSYKKVSKTTYVIKSNAGPSGTVPVTEKKLGQAGAPFPAPLPDTAMNDELTQITDGRLVDPVTVTGRVTDEKGDGIPGVSVVVKGTTTGTATDATGNYSLTVPGENAVLTFSSIGYVLEEVPVNGRTQLNVALVPDIKALSEVVVIGYGTEQRKTLSSSIASVKAAEIQNIPNANLGSLLQGRAAGVQVIQNNGAPGAGPSIRIRGISSLRAGNDPLYVVDEVPILGNLSDINPNDIESIDILKDASAIAIYGARAANGVVLITTKRGKGRTKVTLNTTYGIQNIAKKLEVLEAPELLPMMREMYTNSGLPLDPFFTRLDTTVNVNWTDQILRNNAPIRTVDLSVSGKEGKVGYLTSINYFGQEGIIEQSGFNRVTGRLNLDVEVSKKLKIGNNLSIAHTKPQSIPDNTNNSPGVYLNALVKNPFTPIYSASGGYNFVEDYSGSSPNPLAALYEVDRNNQNNRIFGNVFAEYKFFPDLTFRTSWGLDYRSTRNNTFNRSTSNQNGQTTGTYNNSDERQWINTNTLTYHKKFADVHDITALVVYEQQEFTDNNSSARATQFPNDQVTTLNAAARIENASSDQAAYGLESFIGRVSYNFKEKYILTGNVRRDGSSRFGRNNRYGVFPSVSVAWNIGDESFMQNIPVINFLKLRGSAGQVGNQGGLGNYTARGLYNTGQDYAGLPGIQPGQLPNYNLQWESTTQYNVGVDLGILDERIVFTAEAYLKKTQDLLIDLTVPASAGTGGVTVNLGKMQNKGLEFNLTTRNLAGALKWTTNLNVAFNRNKILTLYGSDDDLVQVFAQSRIYNVNALESLLKPGRPVGLIYGFESQGIYARDEDNTAGLRDQSATGYLFGGGDVRYVDQNGNGIIDPEDRVPFGRPQPLHTGGITNTFAYKGLSLDIFMNWSYGNQVYNATRQALTGMNSPGRNYLTSVRNRWQQQGDITDTPKAAIGPAAAPNSTYTSTRFLEDGSYLRVSNVTLGYELPQALVERIKFQNVRAFITANNLALFTKYSGVDPDVRSFTNEGQYGIDFGAYPRARTFTLGLTLGL